MLIKNFKNYVLEFLIISRLRTSCSTILVIIEKTRGLFVIKFRYSLTLLVFCFDSFNLNYEL